MEFYWGYAAAKAPLPIYNKTTGTGTAGTTGTSPNTTTPRPSPARSLSTKAVPGSASSRKSRIPGRYTHRRTASTDSESFHTLRSHDALAGPSSPHLGPPKAASRPNVSVPPSPSWPSTPSVAEYDYLHRMYQNKQLPPPPPLDTRDASSRKGSATSAISPATTVAPSSLLGPAAPSAAGSLTQVSSVTSSASQSGKHPPSVGDRLFVHNAAMSPEGVAVTGHAFGRAESVSSNSNITTMSTRTMMSMDPQSNSGTTSNSSRSARPFVVRNGRTYLADPSLPYPLPVDLAELHRQSLRTLLLFQLFGGPVCSPEFENKPPVRVLEVGCGSGFWSMMCHRYYARKGHSGISFIGMDIAPIGSGVDANNPPSNDPSGDMKPDKDMKWQFVQHDIRRTPWPFPDEHFDLIMGKDVSLLITNEQQPAIMEEHIRVLRSGGTLEIWDADHTIRMLRPHVPDTKNADEDEQRQAAASLGAYIMSAQTPLSAPLNNYIVDYNTWITKALGERSLTTMPCTSIGPALLMEAESLTKIGSRRLAVPLSEVRWEREGVGGVVTKDGKSYIETKGKTKDVKQPQKTLTAGQIALRQTALLTFVQSVQSLEPILREASGKSQDEWDAWSGKMMNELMKENGTSWGECIEVGAWWATKRQAK